MLYQSKGWWGIVIPFFNYTKTYTTTTNLCDHVIGTAEKHEQKAAHEEKKLKMD